MDLDRTHSFVSAFKKDAKDRAAYDVFTDWIFDH